MGGLKKDITKLLTVFTKMQILFFLIILNIPFFLSIILYFIKQYNSVLYDIIPIKTSSIFIIIYIHIMLLTLITIFSLRYFLKKNKKKYFKNKNFSVIEILINLAKKRGAKPKDMLIFISFSILIYCSLYFLLVEILVNNNFNSNITIFFLFAYVILLILIFSLISIFVGFQDGKKKIIVVLSLTGIFIFYYLIISLPVFANIINTSIYNEESGIFSVMNYFFPAIIIPILLIIIGVLFEYIIKSRISSTKKGTIFKELRLEKIGWNKVFWNKTYLISISIILLAFFISIPVLLFMTLSYYVELTLLQLLLFILTTLILMFYAIILFFSGKLSKRIIHYIYHWHRFFKVYNGNYLTNLNKMNELIKIKGECTAISSSEDLSNFVPDFNQQFKISNNEITTDNDYIEVISLSEYSPFSKSVPIVRENDKLKIFGIIKNIYNKTNENKKIIIAFHIEKI